MSLKGRTPTAEEAEHMDRVRALGCIVCYLHYSLETRAEIHHTDGKTKPDAHKKTLPLCFGHHRGGMNGPKHFSRHPNKAKFEEMYGTEAELLEIVNEMIREKNGHCHA